MTQLCYTTLFVQVSLAQKLPKVLQVDSVAAPTGVPARAHALPSPRDTDQAGREPQLSKKRHRAR